MLLYVNPVSHILIIENTVIAKHNNSTTMTYKIGQLNHLKLEKKKKKMRTCYAQNGIP